MGKLLPKIVGFFLNILSYFSSEYAAKIALKLFSKPRKGKITEEQSAFLNTSLKKEFQYQNHNIMSYQWRGKNKTIFLIHGWESNAGRWEDLITTFQKQDYNIIALDAPAHGNSGSPLFNVVLYSEFINAIVKEFTPDTIIAHSLGGLSSVYSIFKYQTENIQKLVLIGVPSEFTEVVSRYTDMMGYKNSIVLELNALITQRFGMPPELLSTSKNLKNFNTESLIIHDEDDDIIPYQDALHIKASLKNSKLITTTGLGHSLKDKSVNSQILEFIDN